MAGCYEIGNVAWIYFCKKEARAMVTPGATTGIPVTDCQKPARSACVTWIVHHARTNSHVRFWGVKDKQTTKTIPQTKPTTKQTKRINGFQRRRSLAMEAITLALAVIFVGGAFDPYRPINESMDFPFRLAVANTLSKASAVRGLSPRETQFDPTRLQLILKWK